MSKHKSNKAVAVVQRAIRLKRERIYEDELSAAEITGMERLERGGQVGPTQYGSWSGLRYWEIRPSAGFML